MDFQHITDNLPFMVSAVAGGPKMSGARIFEAIIIAAITAMATSYVTVAKIETKVDLQASYMQEQFRTQVARRDAELTQMRTNFNADSIRLQAQYETLRAEIQRLAILIERKGR